MLRQIFNSLPPLVRTRLAHAYRGRVGWRSFSAHGEDLVMLGWLTAAGVKPVDVTYLDVGASHPTYLSNTARAYQRGGKGVLVDPDPDCCRLLRGARPRDHVIAAGIAFDDRRSAVLIRFEHSVFNTFSETHAQEVSDWYKDTDPGFAKIRDRLETPLVPLMEIAAQHFDNRDCHILDVDAEGVDDAIIASIDFSLFKPWMICVERPGEQTAAKLEAAGYAPLARTPHNVVYADQRVTAGR